MSVASCSKTRRMDTISSQEETIYEKWERFHNWVHCICIVTFDLELGQAIEVYFIFNYILYLIFNTVIYL